MFAPHCFSSRPPSSRLYPSGGAIRQARGAPAVVAASCEDRRALSALSAPAQPRLGFLDLLCSSRLVLTFRATPHRGRRGRFLISGSHPAQKRGIRHRWCCRPPYAPPATPTPAACSPTHAPCRCLDSWSTAHRAAEATPRHPTLPRPAHSSADSDGASAAEGGARAARTSHPIRACWRSVGVAARAQASMWRHGPRRCSSSVLQRSGRRAPPLLAGRRLLFMVGVVGREARIFECGDGVMLMMLDFRRGRSLTPCNSIHMGSERGRDYVELANRNVH